MNSVYRYIIQKSAYYAILKSFRSLLGLGLGKNHIRIECVSTGAEGKSSYILRRPQNFATSPPWICSM